MKKILLFIITCNLFSCDPVMAQKSSKCVTPPPPTVGTAQIAYVSNFYCPNDTVRFITISIPDRYSDNKGYPKYIFKFTGITSPLGGCQDIANYGVGSSDGKTTIYFSKCSGCFSSGSYSVAVQSYCANGFGTAFSEPVNFIIK